jgi:hypothetical protein
MRIVFPCLAALLAAELRDLRDAERASFPESGLGRALPEPPDVATTPVRDDAGGFGIRYQHLTRHTWSRWIGRAGGGRRDG